MFVLPPGIGFTQFCARTSASFQGGDGMEGSPVLHEPSCGAPHRALSREGALSLSPPEGSDVKASSAAHSWGRETWVDGSQLLGWGPRGLWPPGAVQGTGFWETFPQRPAEEGSGGCLRLGHSPRPSPEERAGQGALVASQGAASSARPSSPAQHESPHQELSVTLKNCAEAETAGRAGRGPEEKV